MKTGVYSLLSFAGALLPASVLLGLFVGSTQALSLSNLPIVGGNLPIVGGNLPIGSGNLPLISGLSSGGAVCIAKTLQALDDFFKNFAIVFCNNKKSNKKLDDYYLKKPLKNMMDALKYSECVVDNALKLCLGLEELNAPISVIVESLLTLIGPVVESCLPRPVMDTLCTLIEPALNPNCIPALLGTDLVNLLIDLQLNVCSVGENRIFYKDVGNVMKRLHCVLSNSLKSPETGESSSETSSSSESSETSSSDSSDPVVSVSCLALDLLINGLK